MERRWVLSGAVALLLALPQAAEAIPYFARKYQVSCSQCHVSPPKLNAFGQAFVAGGYDAPGLRARGTWPFAVWLSARADRLPSPELQDRLVEYVNRLEFISGGKLAAPWLSYFVEWRAVSLDPRSDGTLRDRSGRFEDLFLVGSFDELEVTAGQFRQVGQVDVSQRIWLSEPLVLSASLAGEPGASTPRRQSLRAFAPGARSPSVRVAWNATAADAWRWTSSVALPVPGELSLPLTSEAKREASNEVEWDVKGVVLESYLRRGLASFGAHAFYDSGERYLANAVATGSRGAFHGSAIAGFDRVAGVTRARWSAEAEVYPSAHYGAGARIEDRASDGAGVAVLPYLNFQFPGTRYTARLTIEQRIQRDRNTTAFELATIF